MGIPRATIAKGDNHNRDDGEDTCASTTRTSAHCLCIDGNDVCASVMGDDTASYEAAMHREAEAARRKAEAARGREAAAARQVGHCELQQPDGKEEVEAKT